jgi:hypothetical protein
MKRRHTNTSRPATGWVAAAFLFTVACSDVLRPPLPAACRQGNLGEAVVAFAWSSRPDTMRMLVRNSTTVSQACAYLQTGAGPHIPSGPIMRGAGVDAALPFRYVPDSLQLVDVAMELCDGSLMRTTAAVDAFFQGATGRVDSERAPFCPWGARPVDVTLVP